MVLYEINFLEKIDSEEVLRMLTEALFELKSQIDKNEEIDSEKLVEQVSEETGVEKDLLNMFYNLFAERIFIAERENISLEEREVKDWLRPEIEIMMLYMDSRKKYEKIGVIQAFENLAELLGKTPLGIQYKYYDEKKVLKNPEMKRGKRGRKPKKENILNTKETTELYTETKEDINIKSEEKVKLDYTRDRNVKASDLEDDRGLDVNRIQIPDTKEMDMIQMLGGMINNFKILSDLTGDKDNKTMKHIVEGIYMLSSIAASNANDAGQTNILKEKIDNLSKENNKLNEAVQEIKNDYRVLAEKIRNFQESDDASKIANLYSFLNDLEKEINEKAYVTSNQAFKLDNNGQVLGFYSRK